MLWTMVFGSTALVILLVLAGFYKLCRKLSQMKGELVSVREFNAHLNAKLIQSQYEQGEMEDVVAQLRETNHELALLSSVPLGTTAQADYEATCRHLQRAKAILSRALTEITLMVQGPIFCTRSGKCWHGASDCAGLNNATSIEARDPCSFCLAARVTPFKIHERTGTTLQQDIHQLNADTGGSVDYEGFNIQP